MPLTIPRIPKAAAIGASAVLALTILLAGLQWQKDRLVNKPAGAPATTQESATGRAEHDASIVLVTDGAAATAAIEELAKASQSITAQLHQINRPELVQALVRAAKNGVEVQLLLSRSSASYAKSNVDALTAAGGRVTVDRDTETLSGNLIVIDERKVLAGSMWFGKNTARTLEHMVSTEQPKFAQATLAAINERVAAAGGKP